MEKKIERTNNYKIFKKLKGNRDVAPTRVRKIVESINKVGYITSPVIVNEKMEVIDGQGRLQALEYLGMPVEYIVHNGAGIDECLSMNIHQSNWTMRDYIKSYADRGVKGYIYTQKLIEEYGDLSLSAILMSTQETYKVQKKVYNGELIVTEESYERAKEKLSFIRNIVNNMKHKNGSKSHLEYALIICLNMDIVDKERLKNKLIERCGIMKAWSNTMNCLQSIEDLYNEQLGYPIFIVTEYKKTLFTKLSNIGYQGPGLVKSLKRRISK